MIFSSLILLAVILVREFTFYQERSEWAVERRELLNRVQRPELMPAVQRPDFVIPEYESDEFDLVGVIQEKVANG